MNDYFSEEIRGPLEACFPDVFAGLWAIQADWVEAPNKRRGGWSGAKCISLTLNDIKHRFFLKIQENHSYRERRPPFRRRLTFEREARALMALNKLQVNVPDLSYFGQRRIGEDQRALILIPDLFDHSPANELLVPLASSRTRYQIAEAIGQAVGRFHGAGWVHRHLILNHFLIRLDNNGNTDVCIVDLEKARPILMKNLDITNDLAKLYRKTPTASLPDRMAFMRGYRQLNKLKMDERQLMARIARHSRNP